MTGKSGDQNVLAFRYVLHSTPEAVRETLTSLRCDLESQSFFTCPGDMWELVIAEVLNNIVEHAYGESPNGEIRFDVEFDETRVLAGFIDTGAAMPEGALPAGTPANLDVDMQLMPEGGFGWYLIQSLSDRLIYERKGAENHLSLEMPIQMSAKG
ncbi:ATP-binding protein [uncultured Pelagimonas sp.]|uniref:ATP-binding protein n=1 Tax=uncultured Pelagimonas sp. TaxID=1618102 RepID=UPI00261693DA|nr:ATP-binding protein [uncultured Pelagimonas sp.]